MAFYRKYRPQKIADLDSEELRNKLYAIFLIGRTPSSSKASKDATTLSRSDTYPHAFLFTGPKGLGKTSTARIIAKIINCEKPILKNGTIEPCNTCPTCLSITKGTNIDVLEIDGASNRGIDEIRELKEKLNLAPSSTRKKVYIIDEVHMLTTEAFNALLKTIEEPPAHVVFIFCTTEPNKVPATILSRCMHIALTPATQDELIHSLSRIVEGEQLNIEDTALAKIAQLSDSGFRDAAKLIEEVSLLAMGEKISSDLVEKISHTANLSEYTHELLLSFANKASKQGLQVIKIVTEQGIDIKFFLGELINIVHKMMLEKIGIEKMTQKSLVEKFSAEELSTLLNLLGNANRSLKSSVLAQLPLEMALIGWCSVSVPKSHSSNAQPTLLQLVKKQQAVKVAAILGKSEAEVKVQQPSNHKQDEIPKSVDEKKSLLDNLIYLIKESNQSVAAVLRGCSIQTLDDTSIIFETAYKFHKERLEEPKSKQVLEKFIKEVTGKELNVTITLKSK